MSEAVQVILETVWLLLPAGVANMMPVFAQRLGWMPFLARPVDFEATWRGRRLLGDHKTIRGFAIGTVFAFVVGYIQFLLLQFNWAQSISLLPYSSGFAAALLGAWIGFGGLVGDAIKSFFKRQFNIAPGKPWRPWDQIDLAIGGMFAAAFFIPLTVVHVITAIVIAFLISYSVSAIGVVLKVKTSL